MGLLTFFVIFYGNHCYARYFELFGHCIGIGRTLNVWAYLVKHSFSHRTPGLRWNIMRPMLAGMMIHYSTVADSEGAGLSENEWQGMRDSEVLTKAECKSLSKYKGPMPVLCSTWALAEVKVALLHDQQEDDPEQECRETRASARSGQLTTWPQIAMYNRFEDVAREFTAHTNSTMETLAQPVPFPYCECHIDFQAAPLVYSSLSL